MSQGHYYKKVLTDDDFSGMNARKFRRVLAVGLAELLGVFFFVLMGCSSTLDHLELAEQATLLNIALTFGLAIGGSILMIGHISGGLMNPALAIAMVVLGHFSIYRCFYYIVMEIVGSTLAILTAHLLIPDIPEGFCVAQPNPLVGPWRASGVEFLMTFFLTLGLCAVVDKRRKNYSDSNYLKFAFLIIALVIPMAKLSGGAMNPARAIGPAIVANVWSFHWIYWIPPTLGAIVCSSFYRFIFDDQESPENTEGANNP